MDHDLLIIPAKPDAEREAVAAAWVAGGGTVHRADRFWTRPDVEPGRVALYGADTFCLVLAQLLGLALVAPADDLLVRVDRRLTRRAIRAVALAEALRGTFPTFVKPLVPKQFRAGVWAAADALGAECRGLPPDTRVLTSEVVSIQAEARAWVLDGQVVTCVVYEGAGDAAEASRFVADAAGALPLPETCVLDAAFVDGGWCLLEANAAWGAGLNGCDPAAAARCIDRATRTVNTLTTLSAAEVLRRYADGERSFRGAEIEGPGGALAPFLGATLDGADFSGAFLLADFTGASLRGSRFAMANVKTCAFDGADLRAADFSGAAIDAATFLGATLDGADFTDAGAYGYTLAAGERPAVDR